MRERNGCRIVGSLLESSEIRRRLSHPKPGGFKDSRNEDGDDKGDEVQSTFVTLDPRVTITNSNMKGPESVYLPKFK